MLSGKPVVVMCLLSVIQMIFSLAVVALEAVSISSHPGCRTIYAGLWCYPFFLITWVSMLIYICGHRSTRYEFYLFIIHIMSFLAAVTVIVFTSLFIANRFTCFGDLCHKIRGYYSSWDPYYNTYSDCDRRTEQKSTILIVLLASAALICVTDLIFILMYIIMAIRQCCRKPSSKKLSKTASHSQLSVNNHSNAYDAPTALVPAISEPVYYTGDTEIITDTLPSAPPHMYYEKF